MKNWIFRSLLCFAVCAFALSFTSCGDDDEEIIPNNNTNNNGNNNGGGSNTGSDLTSLLVGKTWYWVYESSDLIEMEGAAFNNDGTCTGFELKARSSNNYEVRGEQFSARYVVLGNRVSLIDSDGDVDTKQVTIVSPTQIIIQSVKSDGTLGSPSNAYVVPDGKTPQSIMSELVAERKNANEAVMDKIVGNWPIFSMMTSTYTNGVEGTIKADLFPDMDEDYLQFTSGGVMNYMEKGSTGFHEDGTTTFRVVNGQLVFDSSSDVDHIVINNLTASELDIEIWWAKKYTGTTVKQKVCKAICYRIG